MITKYIISALLYIIVLLLYLAIQDYELFFMWLSWFVGHIQDKYE